MSDTFVTVVATNAVHVTVKGAEGPEMKRKGDEPFMISRADFDELGPDGLQSVRRPKKDEHHPLDHDDDGTLDGALVLTPKHKGGGKWHVVDSQDTPVSGDELFDDKDQAQAWIDGRMGEKA